MKKFYTGTEHFSTHYDEDALYILEIDPNHLYAFWHLKDKNFLKESGDPILLRLYDYVDEKSYLEFQIKNSTNDYYIELKEPIKNYVAKLGYIKENNFFVPFVESDLRYNAYSDQNEIQYLHTPNKPNWMRVDTETGNKDLLQSESEKNDSIIKNRVYEDKLVDTKNPKGYSKEDIIQYYKTLLIKINQSTLIDYKKSQLALPSSLVPDIQCSIKDKDKDKEYFNSSTMLLDKIFFDNLGISYPIDFDNDIEKHIKTISRLTDREKRSEYNIGYESKK